LLHGRRIMSVKTAIIVNGKESKDNPNLRLCRENKIPEGYLPVSKKESKGLIGLGKDDTPKKDILTSGKLVLCMKKAKKKKGDK